MRVVFARRLGFALALGAAAPAAGAHAAPAVATGALVGELVVTGRAADLTEVATAASEGQVSAKDLALRPLLRPGEVVEQIPGVIITQHSGSGKANQYFLRGFNLDHGTDLAISVDGVPVNLPSHAHGQGYADLNFLIPELVATVAYKKGPYYADVGDFGAAGAFDIRYADRLAAGLLRAEAGQFGYARLVAADTVLLGPGALTGAVELEHQDGPWDKPDDARKLDAVARYSRGDAANGWSVTAMAYHDRWDATDQIPDRAIAGADDPVGAPAPPPEDLISRWGAIDPTDGGATGRYALSADWRRSTGDSRSRVMAYGFYYDLNLFSDFTYFLDDPVHGDQVEQQDRRYVVGGQASQAWSHTLLGRPSETTVGLQARSDQIRNGLYHTQARSRLSPTTVDDIGETSAAAYLQTQTRWTPWLRTLVGLRGDGFWMDVDARAGGSGGRANAQRLSPNVNVVFGPWAETELYLDYGRGFHSNDARGVTAPAPAAALPAATGAEVGLRTTILPGLRTELSLWRLDLQSELVWQGDAGANEPSGRTRRYGVEVANWWTPRPWLTLDADYAWSRARFTDPDPAGAYVPEALAATFDGGVALHDLPGRAAPWSGGLRLRYFGPRPLTQDGAVRSKATTLLYADLGYRLTDRLTLGLSVFNLLDAHTSDIDYDYVSRLPGEPANGVEDIHTHPSEPRQLRLSLTVAL